MMFMIVLAAVVYVGGQLFGAETRAKATVWAQGMLVAVGISAAVIRRHVLDRARTSRAASDQRMTNADANDTGLSNFAQTALVGIIISPS